ncbi:hypothetical protein G3I77_31445 [Streptomyces sp. D2-8]|uniref:hypothetical protein n=1 Tax=Streptomyces sp. D2-8 TaxID=2707767 RepID=UPI0020BF4F60|nr:hypothetical protein [Streptomyces sp. D2-8]MCK8437352.1 hypothetical protein [Streptomyces sp. D2-8]
MTDPSHLRPDDRADFEAVLRHAPGTADIRRALGADPTGPAAAHLRAHAHADDIAAAAEEPYRSGLAVRRAARYEARGPLGPGRLPPALAVLTPLVAITSAAALLLTGGLLRVADAVGPLPGSLVAAGWTLALVAAVTGLVPLAALLRTALCRHPVPHPETAITLPCSPPDTLTPCPARAREDRTPCSD